MKALFTAIVALITFSLYSQSNQCNYKVHDLEELAEFESIISNPSPGTSDLDCNKIRLVVHVIYNSNAGPTENSGEISREQVLSQIRITNQFFRNDSLMFNADNNALGYELVLAETDPQGNPTDGILYHDGVELFGANWAEYGLQNENGNAIAESVVANALSWGEDAEGKKYLNTYVVHKIDGSSGSGVQAYAYFPTSNVVYGNYNLSNAFGSEQLEDQYGQDFDLKSYTDLGKTWTHEVLHNFAIFHTFQGNSCAPETNSAIQGDRIVDTPPQTQGFGCSGSCGFVSNNVMDYLSQSCKTRISAGQVDRVNLAISNSLSDYLICSESICDKTHDVNGDGLINILDFSLLGLAFGCQEADECFDEPLDLNCDGLINILDISMLITSL